MIYNDVDRGICLQFVLILRKRRRRESFRVGLKELPNSYWIKLNTNTTISDSDPQIQIQTYQIQIYKCEYEKVSDVVESRVRVASKNETPRRMH